MCGVRRGREEMIFKGHSTFFIFESEGVARKKMFFVNVKDLQINRNQKDCTCKKLTVC